MLSLFWLIVPLLLSIAAIYLYRLSTRKTYDDDDDDHIPCPPREEPIKVIYPSQKSKNPLGMYEVEFKSTGDCRFWLFVDEIIERCSMHGQKVPYIVGEDKMVGIEYPYEMGDNLLKIVTETV